MNIPESNALKGTENQLPTIKTLESKKFYFSDLTCTQKQQLAEALLNKYPVRLQNTLVEYVLQQSWEDNNAPFSYDDITNYEYYGKVDIYTSNGRSYCEELTGDERDQKLEFFEHLKDRINLVIDTLQDKIDALEVDQLGLDDQDYDLIQQVIDKLNDRLEKAENKQYNLDRTIDNLNSMDFDQQPEISQWFSCSDWLIYQLEKHGQCTLDDEFWGRQCCGQSITLDYVIQIIAFEWACDCGNDYLTNENIKELKL